MRGRLSDNADDFVMVNDTNLGHSVPQELLDGLMASFAAEYVHSQRDAVGNFLEGADLSPLGTHGEYIVERYLERRVRAARRASGDDGAAAEIAAIRAELSSSEWSPPQRDGVPEQLREGILGALTREYVQEIEGAVGDFLEENQQELGLLGRGADRMLELYLEKRVRQAARQGGTEAAAAEIATIAAQDWSQVLPPPRAESDSDSGSDSDGSNSGSESDSSSSDSESDGDSEDEQWEEGGTCLVSGMPVHIFGKAVASYFHSNHAEGEGMSWGPRLASVNWVVEYDHEAPIASGMAVHLRSTETGLYLHSNHPQGEGMSWGQKCDDLNWVMEWDGPLVSGSDVHFLGKGIGHYHLSDSPEGQGMSWGEKRDDLNWRLEWSYSTQIAAAVELHQTRWADEAFQQACGGALGQEAYNHIMAVPAEQREAAFQHLEAHDWCVAAAEAARLQQEREAGFPQTLRALREAEQQVLRASQMAAATMQQFAEFSEHRRFRAAADLLQEAPAAMATMISSVEEVGALEVAIGEQVAELREMGFEDEAKSTKALREAGGTIKGAVKVLMQEERAARST